MPVRAGAQYRIVACPRECIPVIGPLEGASAKGSAGGKSVSGALTNTPSLPRFFLFTLNHLRVPGGGGEGLKSQE